MAALQIQQEAWFKGSAPTTFDHFGEALALDGDRLAVGIPDEDSSGTGVDGNAHEDNPFSVGSGAVEVFVRVGGVWQHDAYLKASNTGLGDCSGSALALDGNTLVVAPYGVLMTSHTAGGFQLVLPVPIAASGQTFHAQAAALDATKPALLALSNGLALTVCP